MTTTALSEALAKLRQLKVPNWPAGRILGDIADEIESALASAEPVGAVCFWRGVYAQGSRIELHLKIESGAESELLVGTKLYAHAKPAAKVEAPTGLAVCPITGRKFFSNVEHPEIGMVATYGGPFDSYTVPTIGPDDELRSERYDWDAGSWVEGGEPVGYFYEDQQEVSAQTPASVPDGLTDQTLPDGCEPAGTRGLHPIR